MSRRPVAYGDRIIIEKSKSEIEKQAERANIIIPDGAAQKEKRSLSGVVVSVGEGKRLENGQIHAPKVAVGETVYYARFSGVTHNLSEGKEYLIIREDDILAVEHED